MGELSRSGPGPVESAALLDHLARCDRCAALAARARRLDCLWDATRPAEPTAETWDRVWSGVLDGLEEPAGRLEIVGSAPRWRPLAAVGLMGLAQAAALLLAIGISWKGPARAPGPGPGFVPAPAPPAHVAAAEEPSLDSEFEIEDGQVALIRSAGRRVELVDLADRDSDNGEDPWFVFFNRVESASAMVAMAE